MTLWILFVTALTAIAIAYVYCFVGYRLFQRPVSMEARLASAQFSTFWYAIGVTAALIAFESLLAAAGVLSLSIAVTVGLVSVLIDCVFLWAIVDFLVYVYSGRYHLRLVTGFYCLFYFLALYYTILEHPYAVVIRAGVPSLSETSVGMPALELVVVVGLLFPEFIAAILYLSLLRRTQDRSQRFRITVVGLSIIAWFGLEFFFPSSTTGETFARSLLELIPAFLTLMAYLPPEWMRRRFRITGVPGLPSPSEAPPAAG
jgi:hypothetical protein